MTPSIGRIVIYREGDLDGVNYGHGPRGPEAAGTNGSREHPAMITRVWSDTCVNLTVFFDVHAPECRPSVTQLPALPDGVADVSGNAGWRWPSPVSTTAKAQ